MKKNVSIIIILLLSIGIGACNAMAGAGGEQGSPTDIPPVIASTGIIAEGRVVPLESVQLSFNTSGRVAEVLFKKGDLVEAGDVIARLGDRESLEARVSSAQLELFSAQQELLNAEQALQVLFDDLPDEQTHALQTITDALKEVRDRGRELSNLNTPAEQLDIDAAHAQVVLSRKALEDAQEDYDPYANKSEDNPVRATFLSRLAAAQKAYEDAVRRYNNLIGESATQFDEEQAAAKLQIAESRLKIAQDKYAILIEGPDPADVKLAESRIETAKSRITSAEASITAANAALQDLDLVATINGTIVDLDLIEGQTISPGVPVIELADFSSMYIETDNLTEIEVVDIAEGQEATITPDALPELMLNATIESIGLKFEDKRGDVTYTVKLLLNDSDPRLRWGMTVSVNFAE